MQYLETEHGNLLQLRTFVQSYSTYEEYDHSIYIPYSSCITLTSLSGDGRGNGSFIIKQKGHHYLIIVDYHDGDPEGQSFYPETYQTVRIYDLEQLGEVEISEIAEQTVT